MGRVSRKNLWEDFLYFKNMVNKFMLIMGDLNEICKIEERRGCIRVLIGMRDFNVWVLDNGIFGSIIKGKEVYLG